MDTLYSLTHGILTAAAPLNLLYGFAGVLLGTLVGVLPGLGPAGAIALLLPPPLAYLIMLFGITYGAQYGGSTTSILVNIPGEASSVITCLDGYAMAKRGRAGPADCRAEVHHRLRVVARVPRQPPEPVVFTRWMYVVWASLSPPSGPYSVPTT